MHLSNTMKPDPVATFTTAVSINEQCFMAAAAMDAFEPFYPYTRLVTYDEDEERSHLWSYEPADQCVRSLCIFCDPADGFRYFASVSEEGEFMILMEDLVQENIPGAGVNRADSQGWGYVSDIQQIGQHVYACGFSGQVYKRWQANDWRHMDDGLLQAPGTPMDDAIALSVIGGPHEDAIYAAGYQYTAGFPPKLFFFNGQQWRAIPLPEAAGRITNMHVASADCIWLCGDDGTLLMGNADEGFKSLAPQSEHQVFTSVTEFEARIYLVSDLGLFVYDLAQPDAGICKVKTTLDPDLQDANVVEARGQVLWSIGPKDIARFNGKTWERMQHPDNPRIA